MIWQVIDESGKIEYVDNSDIFEEVNKNTGEVIKEEENKKRI